MASPGDGEDDDMTGPETDALLDAIAALLVDVHAQAGTRLGAVLQAHPGARQRLPKLAARLDEPRQRRERLKETFERGRREQAARAKAEEADAAARARAGRRPSRLPPDGPHVA
jgi:hypothetical protein